jgi:hypothetical protein
MKEFPPNYGVREAGGGRYEGSLEYIGMLEALKSVGMLLVLVHS